MNFCLSEDNIAIQDASRRVLSDGGTLLALGILDLGSVDLCSVALEIGRACATAHLGDYALVTAPLLGETFDIGIGNGAYVTGPAGWGKAVILETNESSPARVIMTTPEKNTSLPSVDPSRPLSLVSYDPDGPATTLVPCDPELFLSRALLSQSAQLIGLGQQALDLAVSYAKDRFQFGKPIGSYQAIKHHLATVAVHLEFALPCVYRAAVALDEESPLAHYYGSLAKAMAGEAAMVAVETSLQVHGAIGYTVECDLHRYLRRVLSLEAAWGNAQHHRDYYLEHRCLNA
jgi:hypothetical protein